MSCFTGGIFGQADTGYFRMAAGRIGNPLVDDWLGVYSGNRFHGNDAFGTGDVGQLTVP